MTRPGIQSVNVRFPVALLERVRTRALARRRSLNGQILWLLEMALDDIASLDAALDTAIPAEVGVGLTTALRAYVARRPSASILEVMGEFDLTEQETLIALKMAAAEGKQDTS